MLLKGTISKNFHFFAKVKFFFYCLIIDYRLKLNLIKTQYFWITAFLSLGIFNPGILTHQGIFAQGEFVPGIFNLVTECKIKSKSFFFAWGENALSENSWGENASVWKCLVPYFWKIYTFHPVWQFFSHFSSFPKKTKNLLAKCSIFTKILNFSIIIAHTTP